MERLITFRINHTEEILVGVIIAIVSAFLIFLSKYFFSFIRKKSTDSLPKTNEESIYLNIPKHSFDDNCIGRKRLLKKVFNEIVGGKKKLLIRKCIAIKGEEGIGKSLFCYTLFQYYLRKHSVYLGWIECNGKQSIFDIIKNTFENSVFHRKNKTQILKNLENMDKPCILFVDQVDQYTPISELEELSHCSNVILIISGLLKKMNFVDCSFTIKPLSDDRVKTIFEKYSNEEIDLMETESKKSVKSLLEYANGNPFLVIAIAKAKIHYNGKWEDVLQNLRRREYNDENYLKNILRQLYKISELDDFEKNALSKLSTIGYTNFVKAVFGWLDIPEYYIKRLCNTYWLAKEDSILYSMDVTHCDVIIKVLTSEVNLKFAILAIYFSLSRWGEEKDNGFRWISPYVENILEEVQGYVTHIMNEELFSSFAFQVACKYENIQNKEKCLKWIKLCKPRNTELLFKKTYIELRAKSNFIDELYSFSEINNDYLDILNKAETIDEFKEKKVFLTQEYCCFLIGEKRYDDAISLCKKFFEKYDLDLSNDDKCDMFFRYLQVANLLNDEESLKWLVNDSTIHELYQNEKVSISVAWSFGELAKIYEKWGDKETSEMCMRHMVVLMNEIRCFFHDDIKECLNYSDEEFAEYMHSSSELLVSLNSALNRKDAEALYIEGRYQEKNGNLDKAFSLYEKAAVRDSLRGMCSLALLYYRGQGEFHDNKKARKYWNYCCERGHRGSYYWLGILLLDTNYKKRDKELALQCLTKAAELGSERAKEKLLEIEKSL